MHVHTIETELAADEPAAQLNQQQQKQLVQRCGGAALVALRARLPVQAPTTGVPRILTASLCPMHILIQFCCIYRFRSPLSAIWDAEQRLGTAVFLAPQPRAAMGTTL
jgi:hypothetical protein